MATKSKAKIKPDITSLKPEDHWSCITHLSADDMLTSVVFEEKKFKHSPRVGADNPLGPTGRPHHYGLLLQV